MRQLIESIRARDPAQPTVAEIVFGYPGFHAVALFHPVAHWLWTRKMPGLARFCSHLGRFFTGIEIHPGARIGRDLFIDHGMGVVIGQTATIGDGVTLYHGVTLGGTGRQGGKRHPDVADGATIGAYAQVLGPIRIGANAAVGAGSVVTADVPDGVTVAGNPARRVGRTGDLNDAGAGI